MKWNRDMNAAKQCVHLPFSRTKVDGWMGLCVWSSSGCRCCCCWSIIAFVMGFINSGTTKVFAVSLTWARINISGERAHTHYIHCCVWMNGIHWIPFYCCDEEKKTTKKNFRVIQFSRLVVSSRAFWRTHTKTITKRNKIGNLSILYSMRMFEQAGASALHGKQFRCKNYSVGSNHTLTLLHLLFYWLLHCYGYYCWKEVLPRIPILKLKRTQLSQKSLQQFHCVWSAFEILCQIEVGIFVTFHFNWSDTTVDWRLQKKHREAINRDSSAVLFQSIEPSTQVCAWGCFFLFLNHTHLKIQLKLLQGQNGISGHYIIYFCFVRISKCDPLLQCEGWSMEHGAKLSIY